MTTIYNFQEAPARSEMFSHISAADFDSLLTECTGILGP
ncbi:predicted protein [Botrytis cinerea T4]|uniref:Uncharacterized protein n=1 Tax=Botryotinia fuckeliana (strain T4) TaxID=999810 RepID=G2Y2P1_BOTF4|nr:predicted protein [Botrytis cinerea T4]